MRAVWKGAISFGLVNIPVGLYSAVNTTDRIKFRLLRESDHSPVKYKRVAEADAKEVAWDQVVKGYEYQKDEFVVLDESDFQRVQVRSNQVVDIQEFVKVEDIDPMFFDQPYYLAPEKGGDKAYVLLREALQRTGKVGIAKVVIKTREHLAAVKPYGKALVLELMHFGDELRSPEELRLPEAETARKELDLAVSLIKGLTGKWEPEKYKDEYHQALLQVIEEKVSGKAPPAKKPKTRTTKVVDLVSVLQQSVDQATRQEKKPAGKKKGKAA